VVVQIEDTGSGIPEDKLDKLFEPFFTTKPVGSGTGLGLSVSKNIIELHGGTIKIGNRMDTRGVVVTIAFPIPTGR
jgi:two-component system, NtrC family, sensor kinase